jgi:hypothetical protein
VKKSVCASYAASLLHLIMTHMDNMAVLKKFGPKLLALAESGRVVSLYV